AVAPGYVYTAHLFKVEVPMIMWLVLALWMAQRLLISGRVNHAVAMGLLTGFAASTQYSAATLIPAGLLTIRRSALVDKTRAVKLYAVAVAGAFLVGTPYALLYPPRLISGLRMDMRLNREGIAYVVDRPPALVDYPLHVLPYTLSVP